MWKLIKRFLCFHRYRFEICVNCGQIRRINSKDLSQINKVLSKYKIR